MIKSNILLVFTLAIISYKVNSEELVSNINSAQAVEKRIENQIRNRDNVQSQEEALLLKPNIIKKKSLLPQKAQNCEILIKNIEIVSRNNNNIEETISKEDEFMFLNNLTNSYIGSCVTAINLISLLKNMNNLLFQKGYTTSKILLPKQNTNSGNLTFNLYKGRIGNIYFNEPNKISFILPLYRDDILNIHDIDQSKDIISKSIGLKSQFQIEPSIKPGFSDIYINIDNYQTNYLNTISVDNSNSLSNPIKMTLSTSMGNLLGFAESYYFSYSDDLSNSQEYEKNIYISSEFNIGYSKFSLSFSGVDSNAYLDRNSYISSTSRTTNIKSQYLFFRNNSNKFSFYSSLKFYNSVSFINDTELESSRRNTLTAKLGLNSISYLNFGYFNWDLFLSKGSSLFGSQTELYSNNAFLLDKESSSFSEHLFGLSSSFSSDFNFYNLNFNYNTNFYLQYSPGVLLSQDKISIGGLNSVRGYSSSETASGDYGYYIQNNIKINAWNNFSPYIGFDFGSVYNNSSFLERHNESKLGVAIGIDVFYQGFIGKFEFDYPLISSNLTEKGVLSLSISHNL